MGVETILRASRLTATPAMTDDNQLSFNLPSVSRKKVTAAFDGGRLSSDSGVMLLALADRRRAVADTLAALIADHRDPSHITHTVADVLRARMLAIGCGYPDGNDFDRLRCDPAFKLACGRLPDTGGDLCSQPTISRWENAPTLREIIRLTYALVDIWCRSYQKPPRSVVLDIDDTVDVVHGHQQLAQWNAHYDERCFLPIHVYDAATGNSFHLANNEYEARAVVQKAREFTGVLAEADAREKAEVERAASERVARERRERERTLRVHSALLLAQFDEASAGGDPQQRGYLLQDLLNRVSDLHGLPASRAGPESRCRTVPFNCDGDGSVIPGDAI